MARRNANPENGSDLRGPQLAPPPLPVGAIEPAPSPDDAVTLGDDPAVGQSLSIPPTTRDQLAALERVVVELKVAIADATIQAEALAEQRAQLIAQAGASTGRYMQALRAAAAGLGINPDDPAKGWHFDPKSATFTRVK